MLHVARLIRRHRSLHPVPGALPLAIASALALLAGLAWAVAR